MRRAWPNPSDSVPAPSLVPSPPHLISWDKKRRATAQAGGQDGQETCGMAHAFSLPPLSLLFLLCPFLATVCHAFYVSLGLALCRLTVLQVTWHGGSGLPACFRLPNFTCTLSSMHTPLPKNNISIAYKNLKSFAHANHARKTSTKTPLTTHTFSSPSFYKHYALLSFTLWREMEDRHSWLHLPH